MNIMQVETYEIEDAKHSDASTMALDAEASELIEKLGLTGQKALQNPETLTRCPYPVAEADTLTLFRALNSETCKPEEYSLDPIPVRVLQVLAHAQALEFFTRFEIWYPKSARIEDPVLIAHRTWRRPGSNWDATDTYVLARWGKMLEPLDKLTKEAVAVMRRKTLAKIAEMRGDLMRCEEQAKTTDDLKFLSHGFYLSTP